MQTIRRVARATGAGLAVSAAVGTATAHSGTTHAGTPHWLLFVLVFLGGAVAVGAVTAYRRGAVDGTASAMVALSAAVVGASGLVASSNCRSSWSTRAARCRSSTRTGQRHGRDS